MSLALEPWRSGDGTDTAWLEFVALASSADSFVCNGLLRDPNEVAAGKGSGSGAKFGSSQAAASSIRGASVRNAPGASS